MAIRYGLIDLTGAPKRFQALLTQFGPLGGTRTLPLEIMHGRVNIAGTQAIVQANLTPAEETAALIHPYITVLGQWDPIAGPAAAVRTFLATNRALWDPPVGGPA